ncbi:MAG: phosphohistidine phosphatase SixA [Anaerolineaceae bacterium]|nr:phosphohistidine phosphatase SixA [Anaerolineaceae bacterium]
MRLYLLRHGKAEAHNVSDAQRRLTPAGVRRMEWAAQVMARLKIRPARIFSSPRVRSRQTADIVAAALGVEVAERQTLDYGFNAANLPALLAELPTDADLLCVGHNPFLPMVVQELSGAQVSMKPGGLARLKLDDDARHGILEWLITPRVFDALDRAG